MTADVAPMRDVPRLPGVDERGRDVAARPGAAAVGPRGARAALGAAGVRTVYREPRPGHCRVYGEVVWADGTREWVVSRRGQEG